MSDPFSDIDQEVTLEKLKNLFFKYKKVILISSITIIIVVASLIYFNYSKERKDIRLSGYLIEIISIINDDEDKAINELEKLSKLGHSGHEMLSNLLLSKIYLKKQDYSGAINHLSKINFKGSKLAPLEKLKHYFMSVAYLGMDNKNEFQKNINLLLSYGDYWSLLGHELRGHYFFSKGNMEAASKDFNKIINEQLSTSSLRQRAQEMLNNINLNYEKNS
ncbi:MAG: hypothetical protein CFH34_01102 [Alphaproteobacteria bacterium MarineAlpha9_Bin4]|nr:hypothetical protein [Pelagibacterales bacterium]PPR26153.1 MAG: hypothetical protein CFH34_01102 [Alphaproteobacteria bacterium MarineAlpha9_Bin4]